jgi:hypothetical protein
MGLNRFVFVLFLFYCVSAAAQGQNKYPVHGTVLIRDGKATKVTLVVQSEKKRVRVPVSTDGNFVTYLDWDHEYILHFSRIGYVSKSIEFSTKISGSVKKESIFPYEIVIELFPVFPNVDTIFYKKPVAKIHYSKTIQDFDYDLDYQLSIQEKTEQTKIAYQKWVGMRTRTSKDQLNTKQNQIKSSSTRSQILVEKPVMSDHVPENVIAQVSVNTPKQDNPFGLPPLNVNYPQGKTVEIHKVKGKQIMRVVLVYGEEQRIYYQVSHDWGAKYYFILESSGNYRSISKYNFDKFTKD